MAVENIDDKICYSTMPDGCIGEVCSFIYDHPDYQYLGGEYIRDRRRFVFHEPDCWILNVPWKDLGEIVQEYGKATRVWHHFPYGNPANIRISCGEYGFDERMGKQHEFWSYINKKWSR